MRATGPALAVLVALSGCRCEPVVQPLGGSIQVSLDEQGPWSSAATLTLDDAWGQARLAGRAFIKNAGRDAIDLTVGAQPAELTVGLSSAELLPGEIREVGVLLVRPLISTPEDFSAQVGIASGSDSATIIVGARLRPSACPSTTVVDFGLVPAGATRARTIHLENPSARDSVLSVVSQGLDPAFVVTPSSLVVHPSHAADVVVQFKPQTTGEFRGEFQLALPPACDAARLEVRGKAVSSTLWWQPEAIDCGWIAPGGVARRSVTFSNLGDASARLTPSALTSATFLLPADSWGLDGGLDLAPHGSATRDIECRPAGLGLFVGQLDFGISGVAGQAQGVIALQVGGAAPSLLAPGTLDFGLTARTEDAGVQASRWLRLENVGGPAEAPPTSTRLVVSHVEISADNANTSAAEFAVPTLGQVDAGGTLDLKVQFTPRSVGAKAALLRIDSNDPVHPSTLVRVTANVATYAACQYDVNETALEFGVVHATNPMSRSLVFRNRGTEPCLLRAQLSPRTPDDYQMSVVGPLEVAAGTELELPIQLWPRQAEGNTVRPILGTLELEASAPLAPSVGVPLTGAAGPACFGPLPTEVNLGAVVPGQTSTGAGVRWLNHCRGDWVNPTVMSPLTIRRVTLVGDTSALSVTLHAPIPDGGLNVLYDGFPGLIANGGMAPNTVPFEVQASPTVTGLVRGAVIVEIEQNGRSRKHVVPIRASGNPTRLTEDVYTQGGGSPVDVVLSVDNQFITWSVAQFVANATAFIAHLVRSASDFRIGVLLLNAGKGIPSWRGKFALDSASASPTIGPQDPNAVQSLRDRLTSPSCRDDQGAYFSLCSFGSGGRLQTYSTWRAVTEPNATRFNGGIPRPGARLAMISMSDRAEEDAMDGWGSYAFPDFPMTVEDTGDVVRLFQEVKGVTRPQLLSWGGLSGMEYAHHPTANCDFDNFGDAAKIYVTPLLVLQSAAGAVVEEVCPAVPTDFPENVERMAEVASGLRTHFHLSAPVDPAVPLSVMVNALPVASTDAQGVVWALNPARNEVRFRLDRTPNPGDQVVVRYATRP